MRFVYNTTPRVDASRRAGLSAIAEHVEYLLSILLTIQHSYGMVVILVKCSLWCDGRQQAGVTVGRTWKVA